MDYTLFNAASLVLGLIAWALPVINLIKPKQGRIIVFAIVSLCACAAALFFQIAYQNYLVRIEDWSAVRDTSNAVVMITGVLLLVTFGLNAVTVYVAREKNNEASV